MATLVEDVRCTACRSYGVFVDVSTEGSQVLVEARCYTCGHDYGVLGSAPRSRGERLEEAFDAGEVLVREVLG